MKESRVLELSDHAKKVIDSAISKYPEGKQQSAILCALTEVQHENKGYLTPAHMDAVANYLDIPRIAVYEVASFYSMYETEEGGRHCVAICTNVSCMLSGSDKIVEHVERKLGIKLGESTPDGLIFLKKEEECLAACCGAPMMQVDHVYHENLTTADVDNIMDGLK